MRTAAKLSRVVGIAFVAVLFLPAAPAAAGDLLGQAEPIPPQPNERCPGGGAGDSGASVGAPRPDSQTADPDSGPAEPDEGLPSVGSIGSFGAAGAGIGVFLTCPAPPGDVADAEDDLVAPNRIDAGAGAMASASGAGPGAGAIMGGSALLAAVLNGLRRRRRH